MGDAPDGGYAARAEAAQANRRSPAAFVVDRSRQIADVTRWDGYVASYQPLRGRGLTLQDAAAAVREVQDVS